ncbi:uncharacterized protein LOC131671290 isoform X2 [Phymastichus coffea]|nr:uncharacterized protein LOC131671290 isoform X2 [Phymastichus coffea]XP_058803581.1 uncharacterized protein LOC131671290 isoform X2 [Phymastichus coffea]XP_058803582.1 uncharacterized protein LOC131671290 isoform X2 [Phymastichus coffea]
MGDNDSGYGESATSDAMYNVQLPDGTAFLDIQLAGHCFDHEKNKVGMLRGPNGHVFKPVIKPILGKREIDFYENLQVSGNPTDIELRRYAPAYYGAKEMKIFDRQVKFLELQDITDGMSEPCVMDVKIGKRTWDPEATAEKRITEEDKYAVVKNNYGFCIPGFQVYRLPSGELHKFDKNYGKQLNSQTLVEALEMFLNGSRDYPPSRDLLVRLLSILWKILAIFREQRRYHIYSSSLLIAYDAKRLRHYLHRHLNNSHAESFLRTPVLRVKPFVGIGRSLGSLNRLDRVSTPSPLSSPTAQTIFQYPRPDSPKLDVLHKAGSGSHLAVRPSSPKPEVLKKSGSGSHLAVRPGSPKMDSPSRSPKLNKALDRIRGLKRSISLQNCENIPEKNNVEFVQESFSSIEIKAPKRIPDLTVHKLCRTHSYSNNFDADIIQMKEDYAAILSELSSNSTEKQNWVRVYMIDFAHVYPAENCQLDNNYLDGIENLINLLEKFLV